MRATFTYASTWKRTAFFVGLFWLISVLASGQTQNTFTDTLCVGSQDVHYGIQNASATSTYEWGFVSGPGYTATGTIDSSIVAGSTDSIIEIDWDMTPGLAGIYVIETSDDGCSGDTVYLDIFLNDLPTIAMAGDSVCHLDTSYVTFTLTGAAPWDIAITDGSTTYNFTANSSPATFGVDVFAPNPALNLQVVSVTDANGCDADVTGVNADFQIYPRPVTGGIYHY